MSNKAKLILLAVIAVALIVLFMVIQSGGNWDYILPRRGKKVLALLLTGFCIAFSTMIFQTITNNRILTPSMIGLDWLYMLIQTAIVFIFGATGLTTISNQWNFGLSVGLMVLFALLLHRLMFRKEGTNIYYLLLVGLVLGTLFQSTSSFMQMLINPNAFLVLQGKLFASFSSVNSDLLTISVVAVLVITLYFKKLLTYLDVISLGKEHAINLGVPYDSIVKRLLIVVAILASIATALVGPITFFGLLVANVTHQFLRTYRHSQLIVGAVLIGMIALVGGQLMVERVFTFTTTLSVIVNFIGGSYFLYLLLKENKSW
ncbi:putative ABC transporter permease protein YclO [Paenibacillus tyrfis]|uniref:iron chelate uptake ABC transporter family permease subunit n=1 Tax=Paenibacillus TaxID=44249 RepID=UPI00248F9D2D|nr:iron chelate uptake ABC transporter family permease subunit [Paenibacillus tyrfis]GLI10058.1 putative ABC transporter permease protein YclO [Paenibacillus tyrfis]GMX62530.1 petrobactin ABC transporter permease YclO [Paenibacillus elgii]